MFKKHKHKAGTQEVYQEVPAKTSVYMTLIVITAVTVPLGWWNIMIGAEGSKVADTSRYREVVSVVDSNVRALRGIINNSHLDERQIVGTLPAKVTLITPDRIPEDGKQRQTQEAGGFDIELSAIFWSETDPLVTIDGENYGEGDLIKGHRIVDIREQSVVFEDPMGEKVIKGFYDYLK